MNKSLPKKDRLTDHRERTPDDLSWLAQDNPLDAPEQTDPIDRVLDEMMPGGARIKSEHIPEQERSDSVRDMTREDIAKCDAIVQQIKDAVRTFYKNPTSVHAEEAFWYEEVVENHGIVRKELIDYIKERSLAENGAHETQDSVLEKALSEESMSTEQKKAVVQMVYSKEKMQAYARVSREGESAIERFWSDEGQHIRSIDGVSNGDSEQILRTLRQLIEQTYVRRVIRDATEQIWQKYVHIDHNDPKKNEAFWSRVAQKTTVLCPAIMDHVVASEIARMRADMEFRLVQEKKTNDVVDRQGQNEKIDMLKKDVDAARMMYLEKKKKQETAWNKIKRLFLNVDAQEHADIRFLRQDYEHVYKRYRSARVAQARESDPSGDVRIFERMLDLDEAKKRFDAETTMKAVDVGHGAMRVMERTSQWLRGAPVAMRRGLVTAFLAVGLVFGASGTIGERANSAITVPIAHQTIQQQEFVHDRPTLQADVAAVVAESGRALGLEREDRHVSGGENEKIYNNTGVETVENSVRLTVAKKGDGIESVIAQYLHKEHKDMLKKEGKTAGQAAHVIAQKYAREHPHIDINAVLLGTQIIVDHVQKNVHNNVNGEQGVMKISDFTILEINPKRVIAEKSMNVDVQKVTSEKTSDKAVSVEGSHVEGDGKNIDRDKMNASHKENIADIGYVLEDARAKTMITAKTKELFGVMTGETVRDFRMRSMASVLNDAYEDKARQERVRLMIAQARIILGDHNMPRENNSIGLFMVRLYDKIVKLGHNEQDTQVLLRRVFDNRG